jgi:hypothetical protein
VKQLITTETRTAAIQAAVKAATHAVKMGQGASQPIKWKGGELVLPVASIDLDLVLLNPHSHRISAQLQSLDVVRQKTVSDDPFGDEAQRIITSILHDTIGFDRIKNALDRDGQQEPGVLTTAGVLINANTRAVALRQLRKQYVKVVVLPADATMQEITDLELQLQMELEVKQDYTFTNSLLFIEDLINSNRTTLEVGRALRPDLTDSKADKKRATEQVEQELRLLAIVREVISMSGGAFNFVYFDDKRQALIEIDQDYQSMKNTRPEEAQRIRDAQLAGLIAGIDYRKLREVDSSLLDDYLAPAMREQSALAEHVDVDVLLGETAAVAQDEPAGLDLLDDDPPRRDGEGRPSLSRLYTLLAQCGPGDTVKLPATGGKPPVELLHKAVAASLYGTLLTAIENKRRDERKFDDLSTPTIHLKEAARSIDKATTAYADVQGRVGFDFNAFRAAREEFERAVAGLLTQLGGDGDNNGA